MARKAKADMTYAQKVAAEKDKFRAEAYADALDNTTARTLNNDDIDSFRTTAYKEALADAKAAHKAKT